MEKIVHKSAQNHTYRTHLERLYKPDVVRDQEAVGSNPATRTIGVTEFGHSDFLLPFVNFLMLMHKNVQLLLFGNLYAEGLVPYYIQEGYL